MRAPVVGLDAVSRLRMLADGLRLQGDQIAEHAYMEIWPVLNSGQMRRTEPAIRLIAGDLEATASLARTSGTSAPTDALAAIDELARYARGDAMRSRSAYQQLGTRSIELADQLDAAVAGAAPSELGAARASIFERLGSNAANLTSRDAKALLQALPPGIAGPDAQAFLGLASPAHAAEFVHIIQKIARFEGSTFDRERLGIIELLGAATPEADARLRSIALGIVERDPDSLKPPAWNRLAWLLELDADARVLDVPRRRGGASRDFADLAVRKAKFLGSGISDQPPKAGRIATWYFEQARTALRAHVDANGQAMTASITNPNTERMLQTNPPEIEQLVADLGRVGASSFPEIEQALVFADEHALRAIGAGHALAPLMTDTRTLITKNLERVRGIANNGYGRHPDYAELGRIRTNAQLLAATENAAADAAEAAEVARAASTASTDAASTGGAITW